MKKIWFVISAIIVGSLIGGLILWKWKAQSLVANNKVLIKATLTPAKMIVWDDPAGFTFSYPEGLIIDKHDEDKQNYAHVELTNRAHPGKTIVWAKDTTSLDVAAWVNTEKQFKGANIVDTTLGGKPAKKIFLSSFPPKLIVGTIFDDIVWTIEAELDDSEYWTGVHNDIGSSFAFKPLEESLSVGSGVVEEVVDEEEVIE